MPDTFTYPEDFQEMLIAAAIRRSECDFFLRLLKPQFFTDSIGTACWHAVLQHYQETGEMPTFAVLSARVSERLESQGRDASAGAEYVKRLRAVDTTRNIDYVCNAVESFARRQAMLVAIRKSIESYKEGKEPDGELVAEFEAAMALKREENDFGIIFNHDSDGVIDRLSNRAVGVRTGFPQFDRIWRRGWEPGWLIVPLAPPKRFKSLFCSQLALNMAGPSVGADILYYPCEISADLTAARMFSNLTGMTQHDAFAGSIEEYKTLVREKIAENCTGRLVMKDFPSKSVTIADIRAHAKMVIRELGINPKAIYIDYAETILPSNTKISEHQQQANVYVEARALGGELGACVVMPDRCTKEAVGMPVPSMKSFQGAFQKAGAVDAAIGLCSTDDEYAQNILRSFIFLNRHGAAYQHFTGRVDPEYARISIGDAIDTPISELFETSRGGRSQRSETRALRDDDAEAVRASANVSAARVESALRGRR